ncbi:GLPGLI family protein [Chryseobacterium soli]|uniref:GLPGLI family protein n=1 Tax=Chryseobacterium soli TaxID=445961 RepID=UPI000691818E|nr:GLPGLI family protein [Chryseobacterium soli]
MKIYLLLLFFSFGVLFSQSSNIESEYEVIYKVKIYPDTLSKQFSNEESTSLLINNNKSLFKSTQKAKSDSIALGIGKKQWSNVIDGKVILDMRNVPSVKFKDEVYLENGKQIIYKELLKTKFSFPLEDPIQWKIESDTKMIGNYLCKKATGKYKKRNYTAWFTESVPIPDGPYIFKGLPGLVLEVSDTNDYLSFSLISLKKVIKPIVLMKDVFATSYLTYVKARKNFLDNPAGSLSNQIGIPIEKKNIERINNNARRYNNYFD